MMICHWSRGDLSRSVPFIMCGHPNKYFFQALVVSIFNTNPISICLMMIFKHSGQAPRHFPHLIHGISYFEMSGHDIKVGSFGLILPPNQILCFHCIKNILEDFSKLP